MQELCIETELPSAFIAAKWEFVDEKYIYLMGILQKFLLEKSDSIEIH